MARFLIDFLETKQTEITTNLNKYKEASRLLNELNPKKEGALYQPFREKMPKQALSEAFLNQVKLYTDPLDETHGKAGDVRQAEAAVAFKEVTNLLENTPETKELFDWYYNEIVMAYFEIYGTNDYEQENTADPFFNFFYEAESSTGKLMSIGDYGRKLMSSILTNIFPFTTDALSNQQVILSTGDFENGVLPDPELVSPLKYIVGYHTRFMDQLNPQEIKEFLQSRETPQKKLDLEIFKLEREINHGNHEDYRDELKAVYDAFRVKLENAVGKKSISPQEAIKTVADFRSTIEFSNEIKEIKNFVDGNLNLVDKNAKLEGEKNPIRRKFEASGQTFGNVASKIGIFASKAMATVKLVKPEPTVPQMR